jgi:hypothetical protein
MSHQAEVWVRVTSHEHRRILNNLLNTNSYLKALPTEKPYNDLRSILPSLQERLHPLSSTRRYFSNRNISAVGRKRACTTCAPPASALIPQSLKIEPFISRLMETSSKRLLKVLLLDPGPATLQRYLCWPRVRRRRFRCGYCCLRWSCKSGRCCPECSGFGCCSCMFTHHILPPTCGRTRSRTQK